MITRSIVTIVCLLALLPGSAAAQQVGGGVKGGVSLGDKLDFEESGFSGTIRIKTDYIEVPVLARLTFGKGLRGYVFGGPSMNFNVCAKGDTGFFGETEEEDISEDIEAFEFAVVFGGIEIGPILIEGCSSACASSARGRGLPAGAGALARLTP